MKTIYKSTTVNHETGEVKESTTVRVVKGEEPSYIKLYLQGLRPAWRMFGKYEIR